MIRVMELFALLQATGGSGNGVFEVMSAINVLVFGVFVAAVVSTVMLMGINRKMKDLRKAMLEMAEEGKKVPSNT
jgi:hypothetical protein